MFFYAHLICHKEVDICLCVFIPNVVDTFFSSFFVYIVNVFFYPHQICHKEVDIYHCVVIAIVVDICFLLVSMCRL